MTLFSLFLLVTAAFLHAGWNLVAKRVAGGAAFAWLFSLLASLLLFPFALRASWGSNCCFGKTLILLAVVSAAFEAGYYILLQKGYKAGDLSVVYPLARGTGPLLSTLLAMALLGEDPTLLNQAGTGLVIAGIFWIAGGVSLFRDSCSRAAPLLGIATGACIAGYSLVDGAAVFAIVAFQTMLLSLPALRDPEGIFHQWDRNRRPALFIAFLSASAYLAVLYALSVAPLSLVAPAREISVVIGTYLGTTVLGEGDRKRRMTGSVIILAGIALLAVG